MTFKTKAEADHHLAQVLVQVQGGGIVPTTRLRLGEYLDQWLDAVSTTVAPTTFASYRSTVRKHLAPALGPIPLTRLSTQMVQACLVRKLREGLSPTTVRYHYFVLRHALARAVRWGLLAQNPVTLVDPPAPAHYEAMTWDLEQMRLFLGEAKRSSRLYPLYLAAVHTGMREGELLGLRWSDIDWSTSTITVRQKFYRLGKRILFGAPKSKKPRRIIMTDELGAVLQAHRREEDEHRAMVRRSYQDHGLVFCQSDGKPLHAHNVTQRDFRRLIARTALPPARFHDLRHLHASYLFKAGVHPRVAQERLGHHSPAYTMKVYGHLLPGMQEDATQRIERLMNGATPGDSRG